MTGTILSIERCSMHDGPGIRTTVFFKGCPLNCLWCHNPESKSFKPELSFLHERCRHCAACAAACGRGGHEVDEKHHEVDRSDCVTCGGCAEACPYGALEIKGRTMTVEQVMEQVRADVAYYQASGGGMTLSGGEPTAQYAFCRALLVAARELEIHTCVETCGYVTQKRLLELAPLVDLFLIDWKETDPAKHLEYTGVEQTMIRANLRALDRAGAKILLRCPIVPGLNDREDHLAGIAELADSLGAVQSVEVMPYHPMGASKSRSIGRAYPLPNTGFAEPEMAEDWRKAIAEKTKVKVL